MNLVRHAAQRFLRLALAFQTPSDALLNAALRTLWIIDHPLLVRDVAAKE